MTNRPNNEGLKKPPYVHCVHVVETAPRKRKRRKFRRRTGHRIAGTVIFTAVVVEVAHMAEHAVAGQYVAAVSVVGSWAKDGIAWFLERFVEEEEHDI